MEVDVKRKEFTNLYARDILMNRVVKEALVFLNINGKLLSIILQAIVAL